MKKTIRKSLALLLAVLMLVSVSPMSFAEPNDPPPHTHTYTSVAKWIWDEEDRSCVAKVVCADASCAQAGYLTPEIKEDTTAAVSATCTKEGKIVFVAEVELNAGQKASDRKEFATPALGHDFTGEVNPLNDGTHNWKCSREGCTAVGIMKEVTVDEETKTVPEENGVEECKATGDNVATCTTKAKCDVCGAEFGEKLQHNLASTAAKAATCTEAGNPAYWYCDKCETYFKDADASEAFVITADNNPIVIPAIGGECEMSDKWTLVGKDGEDFDCEVGGTKVKCCIHCGRVMTEPVTVEPGAHSITKDWIYESATGGAFVCADGGKRYKECTVCGKRTSEEEVRPSPQQHDWVTVDAVKATCGKPGHNEFDRCQRCGLEKGRVDEPALQHEWTHVDAVEKKCNLEGVKEHYYCKNCGKYSWTDGGLDLIEDIKDESGKVIKTVQEQISDGKGDHTLKSYVNPKDASCILAGRKEVFKCEVCGQLVVAADQKQDGTYEDGAYEIDGVYYKDIAAVTEANTPALGHYWFDDMKDDSVGYVPAECNKEGSHIKVCLRCSKKETVTDPALPHVKGDPVLGTDGNPVEGPATCTEPAYVLYICANCGEQYKEFSTEEPSGHEWSSELTVAYPATCTEKGAHGYKCNNCDEYTGLVEDIDALGHDLTVESEAATCVKAGFTHTKCSRCDYDVTEEIPATGKHVDANNDGYCDNCNTYTTCSHICHKKDPFSQFIWFIMNVWNQFLGINQICTECGAKHYEKAINIVVPD